MKNSFKLVTILGIPIEINLSWLIILALVIFSLARGYFPVQLPGAHPFTYWFIGIITALMLFACLILHELSHSVVAKLNNLPIAKITLFVFGGVAHMEKEPQSPKTEFKIAVAGPLMSFALSFIFWLVSLFSLYFNPVIWVITDYLSFFNLAVAIFNLMPGFPLDGGRVLRAILWHFSKNLKTATRIASNFGKFFAFLLMALGLLGLISGSFISGVWFIFLGFFLLEAAEMSYRQVLVKNVLSGFKIKNIMSTNVVYAPPDITIQELIENYFFRYRHNCFPIIKDDKVLGVITFHDAKEILKESWGTLHVYEAMVPLNDDLIIDEDASAEEALAKLIRNGVGRLLIIKSNKLTGIVSQRDIMKLFRFRLEED